MSQQVIDARLKIALINAKKIKTERTRVWEKLRTKHLCPAFVLTGYPTVGHRKPWFEKKAGVMVFKVFRGLDSKCYRKVTNEFVTDSFILQTREFWGESGFLVTIKEIPSTRLRSGEIRVRTIATMIDATKPFAAYLMLCHRTEEDQLSLAVREATTIKDAMERIQTAIMKEVDALATTKISAISMPVFYERRPRMNYLKPDVIVDHLLMRLAHMNTIPGMPNDPLPWLLDAHDDPYFLPLEEVIMKPEQWGAKIWERVD